MSSVAIRAPPAVPTPGDVNPAHPCGLRRAPEKLPMMKSLAPARESAMSTETGDRSPAPPGATREWAALLATSFDRIDAERIVDELEAAVAALTGWVVEATYLCVGGLLVPRRLPPNDLAGVEMHLHRSDSNGSVSLPGRGWGGVYALQGGPTTSGYVVVSAAAEPSDHHRLLVSVLTQKAAAALASAQERREDTVLADDLTRLNGTLQREIQGLRARTRAQHQLAAAIAAGRGEQGVADTLHELTGLAVCVEDRFGYLRAWAGPGCPKPDPKPDSGREQLLHLLGGQSGAVRVKDRLAVLVQCRGDVLGLVALIDRHKQARDDDVSALEYSSTILGVELAHQRHLAELELTVRGDLLDHLLAGTDASAAYARAAALDYDLRPPHYVVVIHHPHAAASALSAAACQAADRQHLKYLHGHHAGMVVLLIDGPPEAAALYRAVSARLGDPAVTIGISPACATPADYPESFTKACRVLNVRLRSATPFGASTYDELGFYRLIDAAHVSGGVEDYVLEWLGVLLDYDENKNAELVHTLSCYLECGGNYDDTAAALHIHRSTLRYRLARIGDLTGYNLRDVDTRFNVHAAIRAWRFLNPTAATDDRTATPPTEGRRSNDST